MRSLSGRTSSVWVSNSGLPSCDCCCMSQHWPFWMKPQAHWTPQQKPAATGPCRSTAQALCLLVRLCKPIAAAAKLLLLVPKRLAVISLYNATITHSTDVRAGCLSVELLMYPDCTALAETGVVSCMVCTSCAIPGGAPQVSS